VQDLGQGYRVQCGTCDEAEWNPILLGFDDAVLYQTWAYGATRWGARNLGHVVVSRDGQAMAAAQVRLTRVPALGVGVAYSAWGPMCRPRGGGGDLGNYRRILRGLRQAYSRQLGLSLRLRPQDRQDGGDAEAVRRLLTEEGFAHQGAVEHYQTIEMDVSGPPDRLRGTLGRSWKQQLRRGEGEGLEIQEGTGPELYRAFLRLYAEMKERKQFVAFVDSREMESVQERLPEALKMRITLCSAGGEPVSALVYSALGDTAVGILAATGPRGRELRAGYVMWWRTVETLNRRGFRRFDLGGVDFERSPGPARFKQGLAGKSGRPVEHLGQFDAPGGALSRLCLGVGSALHSAYRRMRLRVNGRPHNVAGAPAAAVAAEAGGKEGVDG